MGVHSVELAGVLPENASLFAAVKAAKTAL